MANTKIDGADVFFYWVNSAPSNLEAINNYTKVGLVKSSSWQRTIDMLDARDKDSAAGADDIPGDLSESITLEMNWPVDDNAGQLLLHFAADNETKGYWLFSDNVVGHFLRYGRGYVESMSETFDDNSVATCSVTIKVQGKSTRSIINT